MYDCMKKILCRKLEALMIHSNFSETMQLIGFENFESIQDQAYTEEHARFKEFEKWCIGQYDDIPKVEPKEHTKFYIKDIKNPDKRYIVKEMIDNWLDWEIGTKQLIEDLYERLTPTNKHFVSADLLDVSSEIIKVRNYKKQLEAMTYDIPYILSIEAEEEE